jgi:hypothetical protein
MLAEVSAEAVGEERGSPRLRTWYHSDGGDLYVWEGKGSAFSSFQVSFLDRGLERREWWLEWSELGARAGLVDSKEVGSRTHDLKSPTVDLSSARIREAARRAEEFLSREGARLPGAVRAFLDDKLASLR